jgi:hypothetical protein
MLAGSETVVPHSQCIHDAALPGVSLNVTSWLVGPSEFKTAVVGRLLGHYGS